MRDVDPRRRVPRTDALLADPALAAAAGTFGRDRVKAAIVRAQRRARAGELTPEQVREAALADLPAPAPRAVLNATGVVLHTNLGRAPLAAAAVDALVAAAGHTDVELDLRTGRRARRGREALDALAAAVPGAAGVHVVNNGAAALVLAATALAADREIVVSRGELVEIGDGFRLPDLLESTGARLREVGTTNRTALADYAAAVGPRTGFVLKVHPSNFRVTGFTSAVPVAELATLGVPVVADIGSGLLAPDPLLPDEPDAATTLSAGAHLVTASGDKLLGGPQAGLLLGAADLVERLRRHPLARALRVDKLTLAALAATLHAPTTPTREALHAEPGALRARTERLRDRLGEDGCKAEVVPSVAVVGGGGAPGVDLDSWALSLPERYAEPLRTGAPPILGRVLHGRLLLDLRCVPAAADPDVRAAILRVGA
ncbi:L-seryl-tRNA(Sec) selenium transferase [Micromonospora sp. MA102]|uniref:L-seryl-tRNA(Sec) selenium transferase n=1 Tax=Micromonospora sp. MA102 TaxID=2952755 RepID=UPI0021C97215|nr:L-seryl-tRNA(Sec) selenium transferase [Micromonospora sp. MA102]